MARISNGRKRIELKKISKETDLLVTFSKRRSGLFKKASELCTLCGVELAFVVFSPRGRVFTFGHPSLETVVDNFLLNGGNQSNSSTVQLGKAHRNASVQELNLQLTELQNTLEVQKNHGDELTRLRKEKQQMYWWEKPIQDLGLEELERLKIGMSEVKRYVGKQVKKLVMIQHIVPNHVASSSRGGYAAAEAAEPGFVSWELKL